MKKKILEPIKKQFLRYRGIIETINDQLKNLFQIDHSRHRSVMNFQVNVLAGLLAYVFKPSKISVPFNKLNNYNLLLMSRLISALLARLGVLLLLSQCL